MMRPVAVEGQRLAYMSEAKAGTPLPDIANAYPGYGCLPFTARNDDGELTITPSLFVNLYQSFTKAPQD